MKFLLCKSSVLNLTLNQKAFAGLRPLTSVEHLPLSGLQLNSFLKNTAAVGVEAIRILHASKCQMHDANKDKQIPGLQQWCLTDDVRDDQCHSRKEYH